MAAIFVTYADREFREAAARLRRRARKMGLFDKVLVYTPKQLPDYILSSPLYKYSRGGGYWCWKPYILHDALSKCEMGDVIYYADSGCVLNPTLKNGGNGQKRCERIMPFFFSIGRVTTMHCGIDIVPMRTIIMLVSCIGQNPLLLNG